MFYGGITMDILAYFNDLLNNLEKHFKLLFDGRDFAV